jgi:glucose dehydrogenase
MMKQVAVTIFTTALVVGLVSAQGRNQSPAKGDWTTYGGDLAGTRFTELAEITSANVGTLKQAWAHQLTNPAGAGRRGGGAAVRRRHPVAVRLLQWRAGWAS